MNRLVRVFLVLLALLSPLAFGGNRPWAVYGMLAAILALAAVVALTAAFGAHAWRMPRALTWVVLLLGGWLVLVSLQIALGVAVGPVVVQLIEAGDPAAALNAVVDAPYPLAIDIQAAIDQLAASMLYALVLILAARATTSLNGARALLAGLFLAALFQAVVGSLEELRRIDYFALDSRFRMVTGTFVNRNHVAGFVATTAAMALGVLARRLSESGFTGMRRSLRIVDLFMGTTVVYLLYLATALAFVAMTGSRGALLAIVAAGLLGVLLMKRREGQGAHSWLFFGVIVSLIAVYALFDSFVLTRAAQVESLLEEGRLREWRLLLDGLPLRPLTGFGLGSYTDIYAILRDGSIGNFTYNHAHNHYLELLLETGLLGLLLLGAVAVVAVRAARRASGSHSEGLSETGAACLFGLLALLAHAMVEFNLKIPAIAIQFHLLAGIALALATFRRHRSR